MTKATIDYAEFARVDMRIGTIIDVQEFPRARNPSFKVAVSLGELGTKWSSAQITSYTAEQLIGRQVVCVVNMPARNIAGFQSEVLIMGADNGAGDVIVLQPENVVIEGGAVY